MSYILSISCAAGSNFIHPTEDEAPPALVEAPVEDHEAPTALVEEPVEDHEAPPALVEAPVEDDSEGDSVQRDFEWDGGYIRNMVSRWAGSDYESSEDDHAPWHHRGH